MNGFLSRGFSGRRRVPEELAERLPPGQYYEQGFPVLTAGPTPHVDTAEWSLQHRRHGRRASTRGRGTSSRRLPFETVPCDIHCVTKWSKLGTSFRGVSVDTLFEVAEPLGAYAMAYSYGGYTTNLPIEDLTGGKAWVVTEHEGEPLPREHGGPGTAARPAPLLLEERQVGCRAADHGSRRARASGRQNGYHNRGDPWREERYWSD